MRFSMSRLLAPFKRFMSRFKRCWKSRQYCRCRGVMYAFRHWIKVHRFWKRFNKRRSTECDGPQPYRTIDGRCNSRTNPELGSTNQPFKRMLTPEYDDKINTPRRSGSHGNPLPSPRAISSRVHKKWSVDTTSHSVLVMQWGQFIDHDMTGTPVSMEEMSVSCCEGLGPGQEHPDVAVGGPCFPISIPENDSFFTTKNCMEFHRSAAAPQQMTRQQLNLLTPFLDASMVYGLTLEQSNSLREGAFLKTKGDNLLPESSETVCRIQDSATEWCFLAGDHRVNVFPGLAMAHTIFMREHNRLVRQLETILPTETTDEELFQEARRIVGAMIQQITYNEWLPLIIGSNAMEEFGLTPSNDYRYNNTVDPTMFNVFATAAFRYGHSTIPNFLRLGGRQVDLNEMFNRPTEIIKDLDDVLESLLMDRRQNVDRFVASMMTEHLFETVPESGLDVVSLNIQRGRDHGLPAYNSFRLACNLPEVTPSNAETVFGGAKGPLSDVYDSTADIDIFTGSVSERAVPGGAVGPLLACILGQQFRDIKYGDSHWFENQEKDNPFTTAQLREIKRMTLGKILCLNSGIDELQQNPFKVRSPMNPVVGCSNMPTMDLTKWKR